WAKRRKALAALFTLLPFSLLLLVIGAVVTRLWWRAEAARGEAEVARELLKDEQALTKAALAREAGLAAQLRRDGVQREYVNSVRLAAANFQSGKRAEAQGLLDRVRPKAGEDLRGWEWYYLSSLCGDHSGRPRLAAEAQSAAVDPGGAHLATG